jgi:uncharacterized delta-60 repeat protein
MARFLTVWFVVAVSAMSTGLARAVPGELDPSLGGDGIVTTRFDKWNSSGQDVAIQQNGKVVIAASVQSYRFAIGRYNTDGTLDYSFGGDGKVKTRNGLESECQAHAVAVQPDGKVVAAGWCGSHWKPGRVAWALFRYRRNGSLDPSFGADGRVLTNLSRMREEAKALVIRPNGKIVVAGWAKFLGRWTDEGRYDPSKIALVRYKPDGTRDRSFGNDGVAVAELPDQTAYGSDLAVQADGNFVVAGSAAPLRGGFPESLILARFTRPGSLDPTFGGGDGWATWSDALAAQTSGRDMALQADGRILVALDVYEPGTPVFTPAFALARFASDGAPDASFDGDAKVVTPFLGLGGDAYDVALQPNGKIIAVGGMIQVASTGSSTFALARYESNGSLDPTFGASGTVVTDGSPLPWARAFAVALQEDGKIVAVGGHPYSGSSLVSIARYLGD